MAQDLADSVHVALPTLATANAMYRRLRKIYRKFYQTVGVQSLAGRRSPRLRQLHAK